MFIKNDRFDTTELIKFMAALTKSSNATAKATEHLLKPAEKETAHMQTIVTALARASFDALRQAAATKWELASMRLAVGRAFGAEDGAWQDDSFEGNYGKGSAREGVSSLSLTSEAGAGFPPKTFGARQDISKKFTLCWEVRERPYQKYGISARRRSTLLQAKRLQPVSKPLHRPRSMSPRACSTVSASRPRAMT